MNTQRMEYFLVVARCLNFSKAAEKLHISHQALSKQIQLLEEEFGAKLLERDTTKVTLTEIGKKAAELYTPISQSLQQCEADIRAFVHHKKTCIRIGYFDTLPYRRIIAPVVQHISECIPDITVNIAAVDSIEARELLQRDLLDLLISVMHPADVWPGVTLVPMVTLPEKVFVSEFHPWYQRESLSAQDLASGCLLCYESPLGPDKHSFVQHIKVKERVYARNTSTYMGILAQGTAFGIVSELHNQDSGNYRYIDLPSEYSSEVQMIAAFKPLHPRSDVFHSLRGILAV